LATTAERVWDRYLTELDRAHVAADPSRRIGAGERPLLLLIDLFRAAFGDEPEPLLESTQRWPGSCGLNGWHALPAIQALLGVARRHGVPVIHVTGDPEVPSWRDGYPRGEGRNDPGMAERRSRRYDIVDEVSPAGTELVVRKSGASAFFGSSLVALLRRADADTLVVAGESTSGCVRASVVDAASYGYRVLVVEDCVFDRHEAPHAMSLFDMDQKYADVIGLPEATAYLESHGTGEAG
jgi:nicotinamidase-related amidase